MRKLLLILILAAGCGTKVGYVDPDRAIQQTDEWRSVQTDAKAYADSQQPGLDALKDAVQKARAAKAPGDEIVAKENKYGEAAQAVNAEVKRRTDAGAAKILDGMRKLVEPLAADEHVSALQPLASAVWIDPKLDLTAALAKRYDALEKAATVSQVSALQAEVAQLRAEKQSPPLAKK